VVEGDPGHGRAVTADSDDAGPEASPDPASQRSLVQARWLLPAVLAVGAIVLFFVYLRVSQTSAIDSDGAGSILQGWDMSHGNLLLHGWWLSDVSFYPTEMFEYALVVAVHGAGPDVVHICAAITFTLLVLMTSLVAKGRATGKEGAIRMIVAFAIVFSPQLGNGVFVLMSTPDHVGTGVPVLLIWLILDRARPRWYVPVIVAALLTWVLVADSVALFTAVLPLLAVCGLRFYRRVFQERLAWRTQWFDASLIAAAVLATGLSQEILALIKAYGGFYVNPIAPFLTSITQLPGHLLLEIQSLFLLFGGDFFGDRVGVTAVLVMLHVVGLVLAGWGTCAALRRFSHLDLMPQGLVAGIVINLIGFLLWAQVGDITMAREMAAVLPFGAILAARLLGKRLFEARLVPALAVVLLGYVVSLASVAVHPAQAPEDQHLAHWLVAHRFHYGIGTSWLGNVVTVGSGERVQLRPVTARHHVLFNSEWESAASWYNPRLHDANFAVLAGYPLSASALSDWRRMFGTPVQTYHVGDFTILRWDENLLTRLR
jgi:hypothetical protein